MHPQITGCGESHNCFTDFDIKESCGCGLNVVDCPFWSVAYERYASGDNSLNNRNVFDCLFENADGQHLLVDASKTSLKTVFRPFLLAAKYQLYVIHLIRDPQQCLYSNFKRVSPSAGRIKRYIMSASNGLSWSLANLAARLLRWIMPERYIMIPYEQLISDPEKVITNIFRILPLDAAAVLQLNKKQQPIPLTHQLSGNALRYQSPLFIDQQHMLPPNCSPSEIRLFRFFSYPIAKMLGY